MSSVTVEQAAISEPDNSERSALLLWMIFTGLSVFAVILLWRYGLIHLMLVSDRTYISTLIAALYPAPCREVANLRIDRIDIVKLKQSDA